jgi:hypothetical protein
MKHGKRSYPWLALALVSLVLLFMMSSDLPAQSGSGASIKSVIEKIGSFHKDGDVNSLIKAEEELRSILNESDKIRLTEYLIFDEIQFNLATSSDDLKLESATRERIKIIGKLMVEMYDRYLTVYYRALERGTDRSALIGITDMVFRDLFHAATYMPQADLTTPLVRNLIRRAQDDMLYYEDSGFVVSVIDIIDYECDDSYKFYNLYGMANIVKSCWDYNDYYQLSRNASAGGNQATVESLRKGINHQCAAALGHLESNFAKSIASFLMATTFKEDSLDLKWHFYKECIEYYRNQENFPTGGFYAKNYNKAAYLENMIFFLPRYFEYLFDQQRYNEIVETAEYFVNLGLLDAGNIRDVSALTVLWGEKSIREMQVGDEFEEANGLQQRLQQFYRHI